MSKNELTPDHHRTLVSFRQQVYGLFERQGDVMFELLDAVVQTPQAQSFAELSLAGACSRGWPSMYKALNKGCIREGE